MPLDPNRVQAVFGAALECEAAADRAAVLDRECSTDPELRRRVEALLRAHDQADSLLDRPIVGRRPRHRHPRTGPRPRARRCRVAASTPPGSDPTIGLLLDADSADVGGAPRR